MSEAIDYIERLWDVPECVREVFESRDDDADGYRECARMLREVEKLGWTFDYYLDPAPFDLHRVDDSTPYVDYDGGIIWMNSKGQEHRLDGPAREWANGSKAWWVNGKVHRLDGPAIEYDDGTKEWWVNDKRHRLDGPAYELADGSKWWYIDGVGYSEGKWKEKVKEIKSRKDTKQKKIQ